MTKKIILASKSPRRFSLLSDAGFDVEVSPADIDETRKEGEDVKTLVKRLALEKANVVSSQFKDKYVIAADTMVSLGKDILGKPNDKQEARETLLKLSGNNHQVYGGIAILNHEKNILDNVLIKTDVFFRDITKDEIEAYISTDEPYDKAGSYAIQGLASKFVKEISGSYTNVVGLDICYISSFLNKF